MVLVERFLTLGYIAAILLGGYFAVSGLKSLWSEASRFQQLATLSVPAPEVAKYTVLTFDTVEPATGQ